MSEIYLVEIGLVEIGLVEMTVPLQLLPVPVHLVATAGEVHRPIG